MVSKPEKSPRDLLPTAIFFLLDFIHGNGWFLWVDPEKWFVDKKALQGDPQVKVHGRITPLDGFFGGQTTGEIDRNMFSQQYTPEI